MKIGLIDVDSHNFPNLPLMKISAWHKEQGDEVEWWWGFGEYDRVYKSKVFTDEYSPDIPDPYNAKEIIKGGTGYGLDNKLPPEIEHMYPDYDLYPTLTKNTAYGFLTRGCPRNCTSRRTGCSCCIVSPKEGRSSRKVADLDEWWHGQKNIVLLDPNLLACREHMDLLQQLIDSKAKIDITQGFDCRFLTEANLSLIKQVKVKEIHFAWDFIEDEKEVLNGLDLYAHTVKHKIHGAYATVYVLTNFDTTMEENLYRIYTLRDRGYDPYVMIYNKPTAPQDVKRLARWVNNRRIFRTVTNFNDYR